MQPIDTDEPLIEVPHLQEVPQILQAPQATPVDFVSRLAETKSGRAHLSRYYKGRAGLARRRREEQAMRQLEAARPISINELRAAAKQLWDLDLPRNYGFEYMQPQSLVLDE